jgi:hypothetical protein
MRSGLAAHAVMGLGAARANMRASLMLCFLVACGSTNNQAGFDAGGALDATPDVSSDDAAATPRLSEADEALDNVGDCDREAVVTS